MFLSSTSQKTADESIEGSPAYGSVVPVWNSLDGCSRSGADLAFETGQQRHDDVHTETRATPVQYHRIGMITHYSDSVSNCDLLKMHD